MVRERNEGRRGGEQSTEMQGHNVVDMDGDEDQKKP